VQRTDRLKHFLSMVCAWDKNKVFTAFCRDGARRVPLSQTRRVRKTRLPPLHTYKSDMDSDEEMQQIDSEPPPLPSAAKGKGKAVLDDEPGDHATGRDDTLPWYMRFLSRSR